jgi:hypothetical protein
LGFVSEIGVSEKTSRDRMSMWHAWIEDYSSRDFTYENDRLPALAGLVQYYQLNTKDISLIGLWISTLHLDLAWSVGDPDQASKLIELPSWTWLSVRGEIDYSSADDIEDPSEIRTPLRVMVHRVEWSGAPYVSPLTWSRLVLSSKSFQLTPSEGQNEDGFTLVDHSDVSTEDLSSAFDTVQEFGHGMEITCLVLFHLSDTITYLMLKPTSKSGVYKRIGLGTMFTNGEGSSEGFLAKLEVKIVELV